MSAWVQAIVGAVLLWAWWLTLAPASIGGPVTYVVIRGDSMLPAYEGGDLVLLRPAEAYHLGDAIAYRVPAGDFGAGRLVIHRIIGGDATSGFVLQGDNNPAPDPWRPRPADVAGAEWVRIPALGSLLALVQRPVVAGALAAALVAGALAMGASPAGSAARRDAGVAGA